jgi:uncharacterized membrane protein required for colicin V production
MLAAFVIYGYFKGFARQVLLLLGIGASFFLASKYHSTLAEASLLSGLREHSETVALVAAFLGIFFVSSMLLGALASLIGRKARSWKVGAADRWLGAALGAVIGVFVLGGIALGLKEWQFPEGAVGRVISESTREKAEGLVTDSILVPPLTEACLDLVAFLHDKREDVAQMAEEKPAVPDDSLASHAGAKEEESKAATPTPPRSRLLDLGTRHKMHSKETAVESAATSTAPTTNDAKPEEK